MRFPPFLGPLSNFSSCLRQSKKVLFDAISLRFVLIRNRNALWLKQNCSRNEMGFASKQFWKKFCDSKFVSLFRTINLKQHHFTLNYYSSFVPRYTYKMWHFEWVLKFDLKLFIFNFRFFFILILKIVKSHCESNNDHCLKNSKYVNDRILNSKRYHIFLNFRK